MNNESLLQYEFCSLKFENHLESILILKFWNFWWFRHLKSLDSPCGGCGRICCTKLWDFSVSWRTWTLSSFLCLCRSPTSCCTRRNSASSGAVVLEVSLATLPAYLLDACTFCLSTTKSCSNLAFSATVSSSFWKHVRERERERERVADYQIKRMRGL